MTHGGIDGKHSVFSAVLLLCKREKGDYKNTLLLS